MRELMLRKQIYPPDRQNRHLVRLDIPTPSPGFRDIIAVVRQLPFPFRSIPK